MTDITEIPAQDGKLYVPAIFDCYDLGVLGLAMAGFQGIPVHQRCDYSQ